MKSFADFSQLPRAASFLQAYAAGFSNLLQQLTSHEFSTELLDPYSVDAAARSGAENGLRATFLTRGPLRGAVALLISELHGIALAQFLTADGGSASTPISDEQRDAAFELVRQAVSKTSTELKTIWNVEVDFEFQIRETPAWTPVASAALRLATPDSPEILLLIQISDELFASLESIESAGAASAMATEQVPPIPSQAESPSGGNLNLLLDVELEATIRFGQREMLLRDVLELRPGAVVELERHVEEPADLLVAGRLVARGEVVVVEGNYGLRITEILGQRQRFEAVAR